MVGFFLEILKWLVVPHRDDRAICIQQPQCFRSRGLFSGTVMVGPYAFSSRSVSVVEDFSMATWRFPGSWPISCSLPSTIWRRSFAVALLGRPSLSATLCKYTAFMRLKFRGNGRLVLKCCMCPCTLCRAPGSINPWIICMDCLFPGSLCGGGGPPNVVIPVYLSIKQKLLTSINIT